MFLNQKRIIVGLALVLTFVATLLLGTELSAQCAMCKAAAESNLEAGGSAGKGLNTGILFMLAMPYILIASLLFLWWRNRRRGEDSLPESTSGY